MSDKIQWETYVPIFKNRFILRGLGLAIGIPFGALIVLILIFSNGGADSGAQYALILIGILLGLTVIVTMLVYGGKYAPGFIIDNKGITNYTQVKHQKRNKIINGLAITLGLFSGKLAVAGAGMMADARQVVQIKWHRIQKVRYYPKQRAIMVRGGYLEKMVVFCTEDNYDDVKAVIYSRVKS